MQKGAAAITSPQPLSLSGMAAQTGGRTLTESAPPTSESARLIRCFQPIRIAPECTKVSPASVFTISKDSDRRCARAAASASSDVSALPAKVSVMQAA